MTNHENVTFFFLYLLKYSIIQYTQKEEIYSKIIYHETCLNTTSLGLTFVFGIDRCLINKGRSPFNGRLSDFSNSLSTKLSMEERHRQNEWNSHNKSATKLIQNKIITCTDHRIIEILGLRPSNRLPVSYLSNFKDSLLCHKIYSTGLNTM